MPLLYGGNGLRYQDLPSAASLARYAADLNARARAMGAPGQIGIDELRDVILSSDGQCGWCAAHMVGENFEIDHITALHQGGKHVRSNLTLSCQTCNRAKGDKAPTAFAIERLAAGGKHTPLILRVLSEANISPNIPVQTNFLP